MSSGKILKTAHRLVRSQEQTMTSIKLIVETYNQNREIMKLDHDKALLKTLSQYSDFYQWLQGKE